MDVCLRPGVRLQSVCATRDASGSMDAYLQTYFQGLTRLVQLQGKWQRSHTESRNLFSIRRSLLAGGFRFRARRFFYVTL